MKPPSSTMATQSSIFLLLFLLPTIGASMAGSMHSEKDALLAFKSSLTDLPSVISSSWQGDDLCRWWGVGCSNKTGHVTKLMLQGNYDDEQILSGEINPALLNLVQLRDLDLSSNDFTGYNIPKFIGSFKNLRSLNLSRSNFGGRIPPQLGNLTRLRYLDLGAQSLYSDDLSWLFSLASLTYLDLSVANLTMASANWVHAVNMLPSLTYLALPNCELHTMPKSLSTLNFTGLANVDLSGNPFDSTLPSWMSNLTNLSDLHLSFADFYGPVPDAFGNLTSLEVLDLSYNRLGPATPAAATRLCKLTALDLSGNQFQGDVAEFLLRASCKQELLQELNLEQNNFTGSLSAWLERMTSLQILNLYNNSLGGPIPVGIGKLNQLQDLVLSYNSFEGTVSDVHLANLTSLKALRLSFNSLTIAIDDAAPPPFQLEDLRLRSCRVGPQFPAWIRWQKKLEFVDLADTGIAGNVPDWFWTLSSNQTSWMFLSNNRLTGEFPNSVELVNLRDLDLSSNAFEGAVSPQLPDIMNLYLHNNSFSELVLDKWTTPNLVVLTLSNNKFSGYVPSSICNFTSLLLLDVSNNQLSGELPQCWTSESNLYYASFASNNLSGTIPSSIGNLHGLRLLRLRNNSLHGQLPQSLQNCTELVLLDLGENKLSGIIPTWIAQRLSSLTILRMRSNQFFGNIPSNLALLDRLLVLDLSHNNLSGEIPTSFGNFSAMASSLPADVYGSLRRIVASSNYIYFTFDGSVLVAAKGAELEYTKTLAFFRSMDLSSNNLGGTIPEEIVALSGLKNLNLSRNELSGNIPENIGGLQSLESLDFSMNELSGEIPQSLSILRFLSRLNLSYNNLHGRIPSGNQLQTLDDPYIYVGNAGLCGSPLPKNCSESTSPSQGAEEQEAHEDEEQWFYLSLGLGYVAGFWVVCGVLLFKTQWRLAYFRFFDEICDKVYVIVVVTKNRVTTKLANLAARGSN